MINSRSLDDLLLGVKTKAQDMITECNLNGIDLLVTSTYRDWDSQKALYNQGRTTPGAIVTNAQPGQSFHNYRCALDVVPIRNGKCVWDANDSVWQEVGKIGEACGLEWAWRWASFKEMAHFQDASGKTLKQLYVEYLATGASKP